MSDAKDPRVDGDMGARDDARTRRADDIAGSPATITVGVRLGRGLGSGPGHRSVRLPAGATVADLLATLAPALGVAPERLASVAVAVGGDVVGRDRPLHDGEALVLVLPVAGG